MSTLWEEWYPKMTTGSAFAVSDRPSRRKRHPIGFAAPAKPAKRKAKKEDAR